MWSMVPTLSSPPPPPPSPTRTASRRRSAWGSFSGTVLHHCGERELGESQPGWIWVYGGSHLKYHTGFGKGHRGSFSRWIRGHGAVGSLTVDSFPQLRLCTPSRWARFPTPRHKCAPRPLGSHLNCPMAFVIAPAGGVDHEWGAAARGVCHGTARISPRGTPAGGGISGVRDILSQACPHSTDPVLCKHGSHQNLAQPR